MINWKAVLSTVVSAFILFCGGFFMDFQGVKADVSKIKAGVALQFGFIKTTLNRFEHKLDKIEERTRGLK